MHKQVELCQPALQRQTLLVISALIMVVVKSTQHLVQSVGNDVIGWVPGTGKMLSSGTFPKAVFVPCMM